MTPPHRSPATNDGAGPADLAALYALIVQCSDDAIFIEAPDGRLLTWNDGAGRLYGYTHEQMRDRRADDLVPDDQRDALARYRKLARHGTPTRQAAMTHRRRDGAPVPVVATFTPLHDGAGNAVGVCCVVRDASEQHRCVAELRHAAQHDKLTGLPNGALFADRVNRVIERKRRYPQHHFAVLLFDLDRFKVVNDGLGHGVGDRLLNDVADKLRGLLRGVDTAARLGGDEFAILLDGLEKTADAQLVARRVIELVAQPVRVGAHEVITTVSVGIVTSDVPYRSADAALRDADNAMHHAKSRGRNTLAVFDEAMHAQALRRLQLEQDLRRAIALQQLELHYQPVVDLAVDRCKGFEALMRWRHPEHGLVPPTTFIPLAEEVGLIHALGDWALDTAAAQLRGWLDRFGPVDALSVNVNVSRHQLVDPQVVARFCRIVDAHGVERRRVTLEITESAIMDDRAQVATVLDALRDAGFELAMDDFGTGHSSLSCLHRFPIGWLKIDRSFISNMDAEGEFVSVVRTIVMLAHALNIAVVAEGVETAEQRAQLQTLGCDAGQGYLFARPLTAEHATHYLLRALDGAAPARRSA